MECFKSVKMLFRTVFAIYRGTAHLCLEGCTAMCASQVVRVCNSERSCSLEWASQVDAKRMVTVFHMRGKRVRLPSVNVRFFDMIPYGLEMLLSSGTFLQYKLQG
jgi:hypothetical protein